MNNNFTHLTKEKIKLKLKTVGFMTLAWVFAGLLFYLIEVINRDAYSGSKYTKFNSASILALRIFAMAAAGVITGFFEAFISEKRYGRLHFGKLILYSSFYYLLLYCFLFTTVAIIYKVFLFNEIPFADVPKTLVEYFLTPQAWMSIVSFGLVVFFSLFVLRTREKFGPGTISRLLAGKYFYPKEEVRIFMFLDLKSSTAIAEKLGPLKYHKFLNDFFREITYPILYKKGEIYQYVGDEISVSWSEKNGLKDFNCIECFFEIEKAVRYALPSFIMKYDVVPEFKAGLHAGKTVAGEIGIIKREIVYSGDTLNTTARIQELCNDLGEKLIISGDLMNMMKAGHNYNINELGEKLLRGRTASISLFGIRKHAAEIAA